MSAPDPTLAPPRRPSEAPAPEWIGGPGFVAAYLDHWTEIDAAKAAITYVDYEDRDGVELTLTRGELNQWSRAIAARVSTLAGEGDRVALLAPQGLEFAAGFVGLLRTDAIGVPLFSPDLIGQAERLDGILEDARPAAVLTTAAKLDLVRETCARHQIPETSIVVIDDLRNDPDLAAQYRFPPELQLDDVAYLQYTSGSTRVPVGVCLTHRNLIRNAVQLKEAFDLEFERGYTVSWLPLFHDMGLVLGVASPVAGGLHSVLLDPVSFVMQPSRWLQAISGKRHVMTAAPNFAYDYAAKRIRDSVRETLDLSGVTGWINGAEPILPATLERFAARFAEQGVTPEALKPSYGLAEATVFVSTGPMGEAAPIIQADPHRLQHGVVSTDIPHGVRPTPLVASGRPVDQRMLIVDPDTREILPDGHVGEIWIHGENIGTGYWGRPEESELLFNGTLAKPLPHMPGNGWLRTEDLGAFVDGQVYVTGRIKDLVIIDGRNIYPHDIEFTVEECHDVIALRRLAAFSVPTDSGEALAVVAERYRGVDAAGQLESAMAAARQAISHSYAVALHDFVLVEPDTIPRTSSGKIARKATREAYLSGTLHRCPN